MIIVLGVVFVVDVIFFFQAEDGIRDLVRSRGLGDVYKRQRERSKENERNHLQQERGLSNTRPYIDTVGRKQRSCLLYTSDAADERSSVDLGGRRIIKKKNNSEVGEARSVRSNNYDAQQDEIAHIR